MMFVIVVISFFFSSRRRHTRCALVTGVQTCALPISDATAAEIKGGDRLRKAASEGKLGAPAAAVFDPDQTALILSLSLDILCRRQGPPRTRIVAILNPGSLPGCRTQHARNRPWNI